MITAIVTRRSDLLIFKFAASIIRAIDTNVVMISVNDYFLMSTVVMIMVMRDGRAAHTNVVMVPRNNHFLIPIVVVVMVVMVVVGRTSGVNMIMVPRNNDLLGWLVVLMMTMMASDGMNNILVMRGTSRGRGATIMMHSPCATTIPVIMMVVMVVVVRCARIMNMFICKSGRHFNENIYFGSHAYHQTTVYSVALSLGTGSSGDPIRTKEHNCRKWSTRSESTHSDFPALLARIAVVAIRGAFIPITCGHNLFSVRAISRRNF